MTAEINQVPRLRLGLLLWAVGMLGVVALTTNQYLDLQQGSALPMPLWLISLISVAQSAVLVALAVWTGVTLAPSVNLRAPVFDAVLVPGLIASRLRAQIVPGLLGGAVGGGFLHIAWQYAPAALVEIQERLDLPLLVRLLYGGITEELLLRWGLMTALVWLAWRVLQHRQGLPKPVYVWSAIVASALLFGAGHLPMASALAGTLDAGATAWVVGINTAFGLLFGYLFWRIGLESAMVAHALTHMVNYLGDRL